MRDGGFSFSQVPIADIPRSVFNRSQSHKTTFDSGLLIPFFVDEALPGDTFNVNASMFTRLATPYVPVMDNMVLDVFFFAVPNRLLWENWQKMMGEQDNPGDSTDFLVPVVEKPQTVDSSTLFHTLWDYFGLPLISPPLQACALPFRAYALIYDEWFRDENLIDGSKPVRTDGPDALATYGVRRRGKRHDYFTSCLPWPQKGPGVALPIGTSAPVIPVAPGAPQFISAGIDAPLSYSVSGGPAQGSVKWPHNLTAPSTGDAKLDWSVTTGLAADLSQATSATINSLRQAFQIQKLLERDARGGTRYTEILRSHFGVVSPDSRLQRPEYLGGGSIPIIFNPVTQTSGSAQDPATGYTPSPQGNLAAYALGSGKGIGFSKSFVEHSVILGLVCARAELTYQQGIHKMWSRRTRYDFYWPAFAHLGEQAVLNREIWVTGDVSDDNVFGYQERWAEYRYGQSRVTGKFRSDPGIGLDVWHLAQDFNSLPVLGQTFIEENPPVDRIIAVQDEPQFLLDTHLSMRCVRPMPTYSVPGLIDHF